MRMRWGERVCLLLATAGVCGALWIAPAGARDGAWYVGGDFGAMIVEDQPFYVPQGKLENSFLLLNHDYNFDGAMFIGYDLGAFRLEAEVAYKRAEITDIAGIAGGPQISAGGGSTSALSFMINGMLDFGDDNGLQGFVGPGLGVARVKLNSVRTFANQPAFLDDSDTAFAWQIIAGVRQAVTSNVDIGLKYRFFNVPNINLDTVAGNPASTSLTTHSVLLSTTYNFQPRTGPVVPPVFPLPSFGRPYIEVGGGALFVPNTTYDGLFGTAPSMSFNTGFEGYLSGGIDFGTFRLESEASYKKVSTNQLTVFNTPFDADGSVSAFSLMGNGLININNVIPSRLPFSPFVGGGIGMSQINTSFSTLNRTDIDNSDTRFAWQVLAGVRQAITDNIDITLRYRFFNVDNIRTVDFQGFQSESRFRSHSLLGGITFNFGAPPSPSSPR